MKRFLSVFLPVLLILELICPAVFSAELPSAEDAAPEIHEVIEETVETVEVPSASSLPDEEPEESAEEVPEEHGGEIPKEIREEVPEDPSSPEEASGEAEVPEPEETVLPDPAEEEAPAQESLSQIAFEEHEVIIYMEDLPQNGVIDPASAFPFRMDAPAGSGTVWSVTDGTAARFASYDGEVGCGITDQTDPADIITVFEVVSEGRIALTVSLKDDPSVSDTVFVTFLACPEQILVEGGTEQELFSCETLALRVTVPGEDPDPGRLSFRVLPEEDRDAAAEVSSGGVVSPVLTEEGLLSCGEGIASARILVSYRGLETVVSVTILQAAVSLTGGTLMIPVGEGKELPDDLFTVVPSCAMDHVSVIGSADESLFTVDEEGYAHGLRDGQTGLICTMSSGKVFRMPVTVLTTADTLEIACPEGNLCVGRTEEFALDADPWNEKETFLWGTSDESVALADGGRITFLSPGIVTIWAQSTVTGLTASTVVEVIRPAEQIAVFLGLAEADRFVLGVGQKAELYLKVLPEDTTDTGYECASSDPAVAEVIDGCLYARAQGTATVTVQSNDGEAERTFEVVVVRAGKGVTTLKLSKKSVSLKEFGTVTLKAAVNKSAYTKKVYWGTDDPEVVTVSQSGKLTAGRPGTAKVWCFSTSGVYASCTVKVSILYPSSVKVTPKKLTLDPDPLNGTPLTFTILPAKVRQPEALKVTWTTSNPKVAMVGPTDGLVYPIAPGSCRITCKTANGKKSVCKVTVRRIRVTSVRITEPYGTLFAGGTYQLSADVEPSDAWSSTVKWSLADKASKKLASINASTGVLTAKKAGTVRVKATAQDGSKKSSVITLRIGVPEIVVPLTLQADGTQVIRGETLELPYGSEPVTLTADIEPALFIEFTSSNEKVAEVREGRLYVTGRGAAVITATAAGMAGDPDLSVSFTVNVPQKAGAPAYRTLVLGQFGTSGKKGYLPFLNNSMSAYIGTMKKSVIDGNRYIVSYGKNMSGVSAFKNAISSAFADAAPGDVSILYIIAHGHLIDGEFCWALSYNGNKTLLLPARDLVPVLSEIKGHLVLFVLSCYSGGEDDGMNLTSVIRELDRNARSRGRGNSVSAIFASDGTRRAAFANTAASSSYDFFTYGLMQCLGWDMVRKTGTPLYADLDEDGQVTLDEIAKAVPVLTGEACESYLETYGTSGFWGSPDRVQNVTSYVSAPAESVVIYAEK